MAFSQKKVKVFVWNPMVCIGGRHSFSEPHLERPCLKLLQSTVLSPPIVIQIHPTVSIKAIMSTYVIKGARVDGRLQISSPASGFVVDKKGK